MARVEVAYILSTALCFSREQWFCYLHSLVMLPLIDLRLRRHGLAYTRRWLRQRAGEVASAPANPIEYGRQMAAAVSAASCRTLWPVSCLRQALWLQTLLARVGVAGELKLGVDQSALPNMEAHAWIEVDGVVVIGGATSPHQYSSFGSV